jgi:hypothetical protein
MARPPGQAGERLVGGHARALAAPDVVEIQFVAA